MGIGTELHFLLYGFDPSKRTLLRFLVPVFVGPIQFTIFLAIRSMPKRFTDWDPGGGALWFPDLASGDPTFALPLTAGGLMFWLMFTATRAMNNAMDAVVTGDPQEKARRQRRKAVNQQTLRIVAPIMGAAMVPVTYNSGRWQQAESCRG
eukprot:gene57867-biopygen97406